MQHRSRRGSTRSCVHRGGGGRHLDGMGSIHMPQNESTAQATRDERSLSEKQGDGPDRQGHRTSDWIAKESPGPATVLTGRRAKYSELKSSASGGPSIARGVRCWSQTETNGAAWFIRRRADADYCRTRTDRKMKQVVAQPQLGPVSQLTWSGCSVAQEWEQDGQDRGDRTEGHTEQTLRQ